MKIALIHLSDLHLKADYCSNSMYEKKIVEEIKKVNNQVEIYCFILSGDLADSGNKNEYRQVNKFFNNLKRQIEIDANKIKFYFVPGNHDITFENEYKDDLKRFENTEYYSIPNEEKELNRMKNFFSFSKNYNLFEYNKNIDYKVLELNEFKIGFCLINSAPYSLKKSQGDKGYHHLDESNIKRIENSTSVNLNILVCHHDFSWFDWATKLLLDNLSSKYFSLAFMGHEHYNTSNRISHDGYTDTYYFQEDKLFENDKLKSFSIVLLDIENNTIVSNQYVWQSNEQIFLQKEKINEKIVFKTKTNRLLQLDETFEKDISLSDKNGNDYFVFPKLEYISKDELYEDKETIKTYKEFNSIIENKKVVNIIGTDCIGKTTLMHYLYFKLINDGSLPIIINKDSVGYETSKIIKHCFKKQYVYNEINYSIFQNSNKKVLFIDDFETIKRSEKLLESLQKNFYKVFIFNNKTAMGYEAKSAFLDLFKDSTNYIELTICRFSKSKRKALIKKVCSNLTSIPEESLECLVEHIELELLKQQAVFKTDPLYIINYTKYHIQTPNKMSVETDIFNHVFTSSITNKLKLIDDEKFVKIAPILLQKLAHYIHSHKKYPFEYDDYFKVASHYSKEIEKIDINDYMNKLLESRIIKQINDQLYRFENKSYLAYFIAMELQNLFNNESKDEELNYLMKNVCNGINSDILLYFSLLNNSENVRESIILKAMLNTKEIKAFNVNEKKYQSLYPSIDIKVDKPTEKEQVEYDGEVSNNEEIVSSKEVIEIVNYYDYKDIEDKVNDEIIFNRAIKYQEILGKILINFYPVIKKSKKQEILKLLVNIPNQIITLFMENVESQLPEIKSALEEISKKIKTLKNRINDFIFFVLVNNMSLIYEQTSSIYSSDVLKENILNYSPANQTESMQKILSYSRFEDVRLFLKEVSQFCNKKENDAILKYILKIITKNILFIRNVKIDGSNRSYIDSIFDKKIERVKLISNIINEE